jgi:uncharacterized damage-inducible protein DinB
MTYYGSKEMAASFRTVRNNTIQIAEEIPEAQYAFKASPDTRSVGQLLAHIAFIPTFHMQAARDRIDDLAKVDFAQIVGMVAAEEAKPRTKAELVAVLKTKGDEFAAFLETLSEQVLAERVKMPPGAEPQTKSRFEMLLSPKEHEMHHRAQLMAMQRMLGLVPHLTRQMQERMARTTQATR